MTGKQITKQGKNKEKKQDRRGQASIQAGMQAERKVGKGSPNKRTFRLKGKFSFWRLTWITELIFIHGRDRDWGGKTQTGRWKEEQLQFKINVWGAGTWPDRRREGSYIKRPWLEDLVGPPPAGHCNWGFGKECRKFLLRSPSGQKRDEKEKMKDQRKSGISGVKEKKEGDKNRDWRMGKRFWEEIRKGDGLKKNMWKKEDSKSA